MTDANYSDGIELVHWIDLFIIKEGNGEEAKIRVVR